MMYQAVRVTGCGHVRVGVLTLEQMLGPASPWNGWCMAYVSSHGQQS